MVRPSSFHSSPGRSRFLIGFVSSLAVWSLMGGVPALLEAAPVNTLPGFKLKLVDGTVIDARDLKGKIVVIDFWGTWCRPCLAEIPEYNRFYADYGAKGVQFLALAADSGTPAEVREAAKRLQINYPVGAPAWAELDLFGSIEAFPTTLIFDAQGRLVKDYVGTTPGKHDSIRQTVNRLLSAK